MDSKSISKKRDIESISDEPKKRLKSRFDDTPNNNTNAVVLNSISDAISQAKAISSSIETQQSKNPKYSNEVKLKMLQANEMHEKVTAQLAAISSLVSNPLRNQITSKKVMARPLLLDDQGREIDENGNLVKIDIPIRTLAANSMDKRTKENPYLSHTKPNTTSNEENPDEVIDERIPIQLNSRLIKGKKALKFVEAGTYLQYADQLKVKEERKLIAGYTSGRKAPELIAFAGESENLDVNVSLPPSADGGVVPSMEWWDEVFLPKDIRESRQSSRVSYDEDHYPKAHLQYCKTFKLIQHPIPIKPLGGETTTVPLPMYLTKIERKKLRKARRLEKEQEKRDKQMMGLIPAPEPKLKLSNFMKVLGQQAILDPSKVEMKVLEQMKKRQLAHEMHNLKNKLTPQERKLKQLKKNQEDTSKQVFVAVFRISDLTDTKHRFQVDVNAQQLFLSGTVLLCSEGNCNIVVIEGGPRGIRRFIRLMLHRIKWTVKAPPIVKDDIDISSQNTTAIGNEQQLHHLEDMDEDTDDDEDDDEDNASFKAGDHSSSGPSNSNNPLANNKCTLVWQGVLPKRLFSGFKFQECPSQLSVRKFLESKKVVHYYDMTQQVM